MISCDASEATVDQIRIISSVVEDKSSAQLFPRCPPFGHVLEEGEDVNRRVPTRPYKVIKVVCTLIEITDDGIVMTGTMNPKHH